MVPLILALVLAAPFAAAPQAGESGGSVALAKMIGNRVPEAPTDCVDLTMVGSPSIVAGTAIVYRDGGTLYVNRPQGNLAALDSDTVLVTHTDGSQLCRLDTVRLLDPFSHIDRGFVVLGRFVPYRPSR